MNDAAGIENQDIIKALNDTLTTLQGRKSKVPSLDSEEALDSTSQSPEWIKELGKISQGYEDSAKKYEEDAAKDNRDELQAKLKNLQARKWLAEQKAAIQEEVNRLQALDRLQEAKKKTNSRALSTKKGELAEALITDAFVQRLCSIASERQVIIFTHRLSLLGMVQDYAKKVAIEPEIICIREESWGTGEPGDTPLFAKKPDKALCSDFRILLERMIECVLVADVVQRYRRAINTMGKIGNLAKISEADCSYFDDLMTKYSRYEHSQPLEAPVSLPEPDELETDFNALKKWHKEFENR